MEGRAPEAPLSNSYNTRRSYSRSPVRSRSPMTRGGRSPRRSPRRYSRSPRRHSPSRDVRGYRDSRDVRDYRDSRDSRDYRDSRDSRDSRNYRDVRDSRDRYERRDRFERRPPRERRPVYKGTEEERAASKTLFIGNLPFNFEERDVSHLMERFGPLQKITIPAERFSSRRNRGFCFVEFEERRDAEDAMQKYQGYAVDGRELRIDWDVGSERKFPQREPRRDDNAMSDRSPIRHRSRSLSRSPSPARSPARSPGTPIGPGHY